MTAYTYGYNVCGTIYYISSQLVSKKQANQANHGCKWSDFAKALNKGRNSSNSAMACKAFIISVNILSLVLLLVRFSTVLVLA